MCFWSRVVLDKWVKGLLQVVPVSLLLLALVPVQVPAPPPPACTGTGQCYRHHHFHCDEHGSYLCDDDYSNCNCKPRLPWPKRRDLSSECSDPRLQRAPAAPAGDLDLLWNEPANRKHTMSRASGLSCWVAVATTITRSKAIPPRTATSLGFRVFDAHTRTRQARLHIIQGLGFRVLVIKQTTAMLQSWQRNQKLASVLHRLVHARLDLRKP